MKSTASANLETASPPPPQKKSERECLENMELRINVHGWSLYMFKFLAWWIALKLHGVVNGICLGPLLGKSKEESPHAWTGVEYMPTYGVFEATGPSIIHILF